MPQVTRFFPGEDFWLNVLPSYLSDSVVSIALADGQDMLFASSGIAIERQSNFTKFVTSVSFAMAFHRAENDNRNFKILVHNGSNVSIGFLEECDLDQVIAVVKVQHAMDVYCVLLNHEVEQPHRREQPHGRDIVALGRDICGNLITACGTCTDSRGYDTEYPMFSTCELSEDMEGGALFNLHGSFVGMNLFSDIGRPMFLPRSVLIEELVHLKTLWRKSVFLDLVKPFRSVKRRHISQFYIRPEGGMKVSTFGETFGDAYPLGVWGEFKKGVSSDITENVVALASFKGESKFSECTGFFIDSVGKCPTILTSASLIRNPDGTDEIVVDLRIVVLLPNKECIEGKLEHYSLHYNIALVSVRNYYVDSPASLNHDNIDYSTKVVAVGRSFESGVLMAISGKHTRWSGSFGCEDDLRYTTCKITKAGTGGPLVDVNGNFVGMNYYIPNMGTPFLCCNVLRGILHYFKTNDTKYLNINGREDHIVRDGEGPPDIWILPEPSYMGEEAFENEQVALDDSDRCGYNHGVFTVLK